MQHLKRLFLHYKPYLLGLFGLFVGFGLSSGLLLYSGKELVNALLYLVFVVLLPALFSTLTLVILLFRHDSKSIDGVKSSSIFGLFFSIGAFFALFITVATQDIAFGWATTLPVKPESFSSILNSAAIWKSICNSCIIDENLARVSQITRLGGAVNSEQVAKAKELGEWWRYLAMATLVYGVAYRALLLLFVSILPKKSGKLFESRTNSDRFEGLQKSTRKATPRAALKSRVFWLRGYDVGNLELLGLKSEEDAEDIVVAVNAWEPPILEFFDYLDTLPKRGKIALLLLGVGGKQASSEDIAIWQDKLAQLEREYEVIV